MREGARALGLYLVLSLLATWPLASHLATHAPGTEWWRGQRLYCETPVNLWNLWWFRHALFDLGQDPFKGTHIFYPYGANLWFHTLAPVNAVLGLAVQAAMPLAAAFNLIVFANLAAAGLAAFAVGRHLGLGRTGALLAGAVYAFSPAVFRHLYVGHLELVATFWMPLALLLWIRLLEAEAPRLRDGALLGLVLVGAAYTSAYYALYSAELLAVTAAVRWRRLKRPQLRAPVALFGGLSLLGVAPILAVYLGEPARSAEPGPWFAWLSGDLVGFLVPSFTNPLLSPLVAGAQNRLLNPFLPLPQETTNFVGLTALGLAILGFLRRRRAALEVALPMVIVVVFGLLTLGSRLKVGGWDTGVPLPASLFSHVPLLGLARAPGRHIVLVMLGVAILAGSGWENIGRRWARAGLMLFLAVEYVSVPLPLYTTEVAEVYRRLAAEPGDFAVLELPFGIRDGTAQLGRPDSAQIFAQTVHRHPIVTGMVSRLPLETWQAMAQAPVIGTLLHPQGSTREAFERDVREGPDFFRKWRIRAIIVHGPARDSPQRHYLERVLPFGRRETFPDGSELLWLRQGVD